jgi:hypothetical protein
MNRNQIKVMSDNIITQLNKGIKVEDLELGGWKPIGDWMYINEDEVFEGKLLKKEYIEQTEEGYFNYITTDNNLTLTIDDEEKYLCFTVEAYTNNKYIIYDKPIYVDIAYVDLSDVT